MLPTYGALQQHVKHSHLQSLIFNEADKAVFEMTNPDHFRWKFDGNRFVAIVTDSPIAPDTIIDFASCNCKCNSF